MRKADYTIQCSVDKVKTKYTDWCTIPPVEAMKQNERGSAPGRRDTSEKRESIVDAAIEVFLAEGYEKASMDRIAQAAAASKRTVYNHFASKELLLRAVLERFDEEMRSLKAIAYDPKRPVEEQLGRFAEAELAVVRNKTWLGLIRFLLAIFGSYPELARETMAKHASSESGLTAWMRAAIRDGKLSAEDPVLASRVFSAMLGGAFTWPAVYQGGPPDSGATELQAELIGAFLDRYGKKAKAAKPKP